MAFLEFRNVRISGISAGVPKHVEYNKDYPYFEEGPLGRGVSLIPGSVPPIFASRRLNALLRI